ncbi:MAG: four helix bundle protein [Parcubacteria group bacterium]
MNEKRGEDLKKRTKAFALQIIKISEALPKTLTGRTIAGQLIRCGTSVAANYRAVCRSRSMADFIAKLGIVIEEGDESAFWLELVVEAGLLKSESVDSLLKEANEIVAIMTSSSKSAKSNR